MKRLDWVFEWLVLPLFLVVATHIAFWLIGAFLVWDIGWLNLLGHRVLFVFLSFLVWLTLIFDEIEVKKKEATGSAKRSPQGETSGG